MKNKNQVTVTANAFYGYIDDTTAYGKTIATQVQEDLKQLATMLNDIKLGIKAKREIYLDYANAIKAYVEKKETCIDCDCDCTECDNYDEEEEDEDEVIEEVDLYSPRVEKMDYYELELDENHKYKFTSYDNVIRILKFLNLNNCDCAVWGVYDNGQYPLEIFENDGEISLEKVDD